jgi:branched-chain amino acid transport system substrate-binding protein
VITIYSAQLAIEDFGPQVLGRPIELLTADDQNKADVGSVIAGKWMDDDGATAIISNSFSPLALAVKRMCEDRRKPFLMGSTASSAFTQIECSPFTVAFGVNSYCMPKAVVSALLKRKLDTWFFITTDYTFAHALEADASSFVTAGDGKIIGAVRSPIGNPDFSARLLQAQSLRRQGLVVVDFSRNRACARGHPGQRRPETCDAEFPDRDARWLAAVASRRIACRCRGGLPDEGGRKTRDFYLQLTRKDRL